MQLKYKHCEFGGTLGSVGRILSIIFIDSQQWKNVRSGKEEEEKSSPEVDEKKRNKIVSFSQTFPGNFLRKKIKMRKYRCVLKDIYESV